MQTRLFVGMALMGIGVLSLLSRLYALQVLRGEELASQGRRNFVERIEVEHDRGIIYDRFGRILVDNRPSLNLTLTPHFLGTEHERTQTFELLTSYLGWNEERRAEIEDLVTHKRGLDRFQPVLVARDLTRDQVEVIEADRSIFLLDGANIVEGRRRTYRYGEAAAHLLGYVSEIGPARLDQERESGNPLAYKPGDLLGRQGIEAEYEAQLRGQDGWEQAVVDAKGRRLHGAYVDQLLGPDRRQEPVPGHNVFLGIDLDLQLAAEAAFTGSAGAVVAIDPRDGAILAMVSHPAFNPNRVAGVLEREEKDRLDNDPLKPWINRAIQGQYAPGSTFKVITAVAALGQRATSTTEHISCPGYYRLGRRAWRCHKDSGHGSMGLKDALKYSCDTFFYTMAARIGIDPIAAVARDFGLGARTGIHLRGEQPGLAPDSAFHDRVDRTTGGYQKGMALNTAIGQGSVLVTPLQLAAVYATVANGGHVHTPRLVTRVETADFRIIRRFNARGHPDPRSVDGQPDTIFEEVTGAAPVPVDGADVDRSHDIGADPEIWAAIQEGLFAVTNEPGGTAYSRRSKKVSMAGKTGTAQVVTLGRNRQDASDMDYFTRDHAWFAAYAPTEDPQIAIAVLNEHSGHGGSQAAPIAAAVLDAWADLRDSRRPQAQAKGESP